MNGSERREVIVRLLNHANEPISARKLAGKFHVSRQAIVGDIALLRAEGNDILSTPKGYLANLPSPPAGYTRQIVCQHASEETKEELYTVVDLGGELIDVMVEHPVYGELKGQLNISTREDADRFMNRMSQHQTEFLSALTNGIHIHTLTTPDADAFQRVVQALDEKNILYKEQEVISD